jgi:hypothetical protein
MNPYLEQDDAWHEFHEMFVPEAVAVLNAQVGDDYIVKTDRHIYVHEPPEQKGVFIGRSDVHLAHPKDTITAASGATTIAPVRSKFLAEDFEEETYIEIRDRHRRQIVTVIELLSPTNKRPGENRNQYIAKRRAIRRSTAHLVEIDLLRGGPRMPMESVPECAYLVMVSRYESRPHVGLWPLQLSDPLPNVRIPLRAPDPDVTLPLQDLLHKIYDSAGFQKYVYEGNPDPPLAQDEVKWAQQFISTSKS